MSRTRSITLTELAKRRGVTPDSLRQRIHRNTLKATKVGNTWVVGEAEANRVLAEVGQAPWSYLP